MRLVVVSTWAGLRLQIEEGPLSKRGSLHFLLKPLAWLVARLKRVSTPSKAVIWVTKKPCFGYSLGGGKGNVRSLALAKHRPPPQDT